MEVDRQLFSNRSSNLSQFLLPVVSNNDSTNDWESNYNIDSYFDTFPPGFRFKPTDEELLVNYLNKKVMNEPLPLNQIHEVNLYGHNPLTLSERFKAGGEKEWYFFTPRDKKYKNGARPNRAAGDGYWKATGADKTIKSNGLNVGFKKTLVFYMGKPPKGNKTTWIMHEYKVNNPPKSENCSKGMRLDDWVLCRIYKKMDRKDYRRNQHLNDDEQIQQTNNNNFQSDKLNNDPYLQVQESIMVSAETSMPLNWKVATDMDISCMGDEDFLRHCNQYDNSVLHQNLPNEVTEFSEICNLAFNHHQPIPNGLNNVNPIPVMPSGLNHPPNPIRQYAPISSSEQLPSHLMESNVCFTEFNEYSCGYLPGGRGRGGERALDPSQYLI